MKKYAVATCLSLIVICFSKKVSAQYYFYNDGYYDTPLMFEVGVSAGAVNCLTDLGGKKGVGAKLLKDLNIGNTKFNWGLYFGALYKYTFGLRLEASFAKLSAYDSVLVDVEGIARARYNRNLSFRSNITEIALIGEFHPLYAFIDWTAKDYDPPRFSPYLLLGIGFFTFNPQAKLNNKWVDLQPLSTEGQGFAEYPDRKPYKLNAISIPIGAGVKYELSPVVNLRAELNYRATNTDYIDDVSTKYIDKALYQNYFTGSKLNRAILLSDRQRGEYPPQSYPGKKRGDQTQNDNFFSFNIKVGVALGRERR